MAKLYDLARMTTATTGTGTITLGAAVVGFLTFAQSGIANGDVISYGISDGVNSECGTGTYTAAGTLLTRTVTKSTNSNAAISLSGTAEVFIAIRAEDVLTIASELQAETGTDNTTAMSPQAASQATAANARGFANIAGRNGGFEVWQRGVSIAQAASVVAYTVDGWYFFTTASQASTVSRQAGNTNGSNYSCRVQRNAGQTGTGTLIFAFPLDVDELKKMAGQSAILQFNVSTGANWSPASGTLTYNVYTGTGAPVKQYTGSYVGAVAAISGSVNLATGAAAATTFSAIAAIAANIGQAEIQFTWAPVGTAGANDWFQIDDVDLRAVPAGISAIKPAFERTDYVWDYHRCVLHGEVITAATGGSYPGFAALDSTTSLIATIPYALKRIVPTVIWNGTFAFRSIGSGGANLTLSSPLLSNASLQSAFWSGTVAGGTNGSPGIIRDLPAGGASSILIDAGI